MSLQSFRASEFDLNTVISHQDVKDNRHGADAMCGSLVEYKEDLNPKLSFTA